MPLLSTRGVASASGLGFCGASGPTLFMIQSTYDAARSWSADGCCHDSSGNTYTAWTATSLLVVTKHDKLGNLLSQVSINTTFTGNESFAMKVDSSGNIYIGGTSSNRPALMKLTSGLSVSFFKIYNPANPYTLSYGSFRAVDVDSSGNIYCAGNGAWKVGQTSESHGWIYKFDANGDTTWVREYRLGVGFGYSGCALGSDGNLYVVGNATEFSGGDYIYSMVLAKLNTSGTLLTYAKFVGPYYQIFCTFQYGPIFANQLLFNPAGNTIYVSGSQSYEGSNQVLGSTYDLSLNQVAGLSRARSGYNVVPRNVGAVVTDAGGFYQTGTFEFQNNNYTSAGLLGTTPSFRTMVNSVTTNKDTFFNGLSFNPLTKTVYQFGAIKNRTGDTNTRGLVFNFVTPETIPTTNIANSGVVLEKTTMNSYSSFQTRSVLTGYTSSMTSTTANGTYSSASTFPTLTTTIY